jgi:hypothetical protein
MKEKIKDRLKCAGYSIISANETGNNMSIPAFILLGMKSFIFKKIYAFQ